MSKRYPFEDLRAGYARLWNDMQIRTSRASTVRATAAKIVANRATYEEISARTGVPWFVVGVIHKMECPAFPAFTQHLHNGDSLARRTWRVPAGRPLAGSPPFDFVESATDALKLKRFDQVSDWSVERIAYSLELYNGFGYRPRGVPSAYLWSFSTHYVSGKYVRDHVWDSTAVSTQSGAMPLLLEIQRQTGIALRVGDVPPEVAADESERLPRTPTVLSALARSRTMLGSALAAVGTGVTWAVGKIGDLGHTVGEIANEAAAFAAPLGQLASQLGVALGWLGAAAVVYGLCVVVFARTDASRNGKVG